MDGSETEKTESEKPKEDTTGTFSLGVEIEGLPYIFRGKVLQRPEEFRLTLHHPNWQEELQRLEDLENKGKISGSSAFSAFRFNQGEIASVYGHPTRKQGAQLYLERIRSDTWLLRESPYEDASGLGRFLMENLLTLADIRSWTLSSYPMASGRLSQKELLRWLERKGFEEDTRGENLIRKPRTPDLSQPIAALLKDSS